MIRAAAVLLWIHALGFGLPCLPAIRNALTGGPAGRDRLPNAMDWHHFLLTGRYIELPSAVRDYVERRDNAKPACS